MHYVYSCECISSAELQAEYLEDAKGAVSSLGIQSSNYGSQQGKTKDGEVKWMQAADAPWQRKTP